MKNSKLEEDRNETNSGVTEQTLNQKASYKQGNLYIYIYICIKKCETCTCTWHCPFQSLVCLKLCPLSRGFPVHCRTEIFLATLSVRWKESELQQICISKARKKDRSFLTSIWPCNPHVFCSSYLPGCIFCYCYISVKRGTDRLVRNAHSAAVASLCPWRVSNFLLIFLPFYIFTNARVKQWITQEMPGHVQINSFAIYNPLLFVFVHFVDVGCRNQCAENEHKGLHQEMKNYFSILCTFFFCPLLAFS